MSNEEYSVVEFFGSEDRQGHRCGYCKNEEGSVNDGMWAHALTCQNYQDLIDRGWRRSGCYCYKPIMNVTCCPQYTIRCEALNIQLSKSQKKVLKRFNKFLVQGLPKKCLKEADDEEDATADVNEESSLTDKDSQAQESSQEKSHASIYVQTGNISFEPTEGCQDLPDLSEKNQASLAKMDGIIKNEVQVIDDSVKGFCKGGDKEEAPVSEKSEATSKNISSVSAAPRKKAKLMRKERRLEKLEKQGIDAVNAIARPQPQVKSLEDFLRPPEKAKHRLELRLVQSNPPSREYLQSSTESYNLYCKYQTVIHQDTPEETTEKKFIRFLVKSPLEPSERPEITFGSYHQQYWLDGKLIAVGVVDLLPYCVSSVYFYYDTDYRYLSLGTYAALRELALTRELHLKQPSLQYYYMGFYIHSCPKMKYKGQYSPSTLLCPETYTWHPIEHCRPLLDASKYYVFGPQDQNEEAVELPQVLVLHRRTAMPYWRYKMRNVCDGECEEEEVSRYAKLVGPLCAYKMLLYRT